MLIERRARELDAAMSPSAARAAAEEMLLWDEHRLWAWWPEDQHLAVAREWAGLGEAGENVADVVAAGISQETLTRLTDPREGGLARSQAVAWMRATRKNVEQVLELRRRGLPADPPAGLYSHLALALPQELDMWLSQDYSVYEAFHLLGKPLDEAIALRAAGVEAPEAAERIRPSAT